MGLRYTTYWIEVSPRAPLRLPAFAGSLVRGTLGRALRHLACVTRAPTCEGCAVARSCQYRRLFDPLPPEAHALQQFSAISPPFVLQLAHWREGVVQPGQLLRIGLTLIGAARDALPLMLLALQRALEEGWLQERVALELKRVIAEGPDGALVVLDGPGGRLREHGDSAELMVPPGAERVETSMTVELLTPARLTQQGKPATAGTLTARSWLMTLLRRVALLADFHGDGLEIDFGALAPLLAETRIEDPQLRWQEWTRYSGRQRQEMPMGGLVGRMTLTGPIGALLPLIDAAAPLHVGKHAAFGMGAYRVVGG
jgi:hypothetical protein